MRMEPLNNITHGWEANIRNKGILGDLTELANVINARVFGLLHWEIKNILSSALKGCTRCMAFPFFGGLSFLLSLFYLLSCHFLLWLILDGWRRSVGNSTCEIVSQIFALTRLTIWSNSPRHGLLLVIFTWWKHLSCSDMIHRIEDLESMVSFVFAFGEYPQKASIVDFIWL